ncbi:uncharacterized protein B0T15DRAFT_497577 [Chaetomium strumarium]|uniref:Uncharacterized protein n=1 Tax=Chaetomium strumarium TaxID=1170767 RepID=A0AAJ0GL25_9PEZI|nr:hypothetical protein B0T15DRAFT_497577 [Chaetomium strumarium]
MSHASSRRASLATPSSSTAPAHAPVVEVELQPESSQPGDEFGHGNTVPSGPSLDTGGNGETESPNLLQPSTPSAAPAGTSATENVWERRVPVPGNK